MKLISGGGGKRAKKDAQGAGTDDAKVSKAPKSAKATKNKVKMKNISGDKVKPDKNRMSKRKKIITTVGSLLGAVILVAVFAFAVIMWEIQPFYDWFFPRPVLTASGPADLTKPDDDGIIDTENPLANPDDANVPTPTEIPIHEQRNTDKITFLILGIDDYKGLRKEGGGNTDVIMIASFDMEESTVDIASIPRDTIANVSWSVKKINSIWGAMTTSHRDVTDSAKRAALVMEDTKVHFSRFLGFDIDYWVTINMAGFESLIDALGGVTVNVPVSFRLVEVEMSMNVYLSKGEQTLNGKQALALARYRGYGAGDLSRIEAQQSIMKALAEQLLSKSAIASNPVEFANTLLNHVRTDMDVTEMVRIGREGLNVKSEDINFYTAPVKDGRTIYGGWYSPIDLDGWLEIVNDKLNPFYTQITKEHVSILTSDENGKLYVTDGNWQGRDSWGR